MYGYIYKTTIRNPESELNGCFYIGQNKSEYVVESYYGSSPTLKNYCRKYLSKSCCNKILPEEAEILGLHREILAWANDADELNELEEGYVNPELGNPQCLNRMIGGCGYQKLSIYNTPNEQREINYKLATSTTEEVFVDLPGTNYQISSWGRVKNKITGHINKHYVHNRVGYMRAELFDGMGHTNKKRYFVHRLVASAFIPNPENKECVNHKDANRANNHLENLEWATQSENMQHCFHVTKRKLGFGYGHGYNPRVWNKGRNISKERPEIGKKIWETRKKNIGDKLDIRNKEIVDLYYSGIKIVEIARRYKLNRCHIGKIIKKAKGQKHD